MHRINAFQRFSWTSQVDCKTINRWYSWTWEELWLDLRLPWNANPGTTKLNVEFEHILWYFATEIEDNVEGWPDCGRRLKMQRVTYALSVFSLTNFHWEETSMRSANNGFVDTTYEIPSLIIWCAKTLVTEGFWFCLGFILKSWAID